MTREAWLEGLARILATVWSQQSDQEVALMRGHPCLQVDEAHPACWAVEGSFCRSTGGPGWEARQGPPGGQQLRKQACCRERPLSLPACRPAGPWTQAGPGQAMALILSSLGPGTA